MKKCILVLCLLLIALKIQASPTFYGPTGLIEVPSAMALKYKEINFAYDYVTDNNDKTNNFRYKMSMGTFQNWEIGVVGGKVPTEGMYLNAKYHLLTEDSRTPLSMAVGVQNLGSKSLTDLYMIVSWKPKPGFTVHGGFKERFTESSAQAAAMGGVEYFLNSNASALSDIVINNDGTTVLNAGLSYFVTNDIAFRIAIMDLTNGNKTGTVVLGGISVSRFL